jgi:hypothetical protein
MSEQPFLPMMDGPWVRVRDGNASGLALFVRHYTARRVRKIRKFVGPGSNMVLLTPDARALFVWRKFKSDDDQTGVNCAVFRNEGSDAGRSSALIGAAMALAWERWPGERLYTYVDPRKVRRKRDPGRCFLRAGFRLCGVTKKGKFLILEAMPPAACRV